MAVITTMKSWCRLLAVAAGLGGASLLRAQTGPAAAVTLEQGDALEEKMRTKEALEVYLQLEKAGRKDTELLCRIALEYSELIVDTRAPSEKQRLGEIALDYSKRAVAADAANAKGYLSLSVSYGRLAFFQDNRTKLEYSRLIRANAETALRLDPRLDYAHYVLGAWNYELANLDFVRRGLARLIYGGLPDASNDRAVQYLQAAIALAPQRSSHHIELGRAYAAMGKSELARAELEQGLALPIRAKDDEEMQRLGREALKKLPKKR
ncbi:MAG: hypothetical protein WCL04_10515 [Verrucomicrobiota bacterium]